MNVLDHALRYHDYGWCVIPVKAGTKIPACRSWKEFQTVRPSTTKLRRWFQNESNSLAIIAGPVSGGLVVRDFDDLDSYKSWATDQPVLAQTLPTVETGRPGRHVYFRTEKECGIICGDDGELRGGGYCLAPPSNHPRGKPYRWLVDPQGELPVIDDLLVAGLLPCNREDREDGGGQRGQRTLKRGSDTSDLVVLNDAQIENAIANCLPNKESQRHRLVFELVRELQAIPWLAEADPIELEWIVREWHRRAKPVIRTKDFEESWLDFVEGWAKVKFPKGKEPLAVMWEKAMSQAFPDEVKKYDGDEIKVLARFCRELQLASGESPFFLSVRTAGRLFEVDPTKASRWLQILQLDGIIELVTLGTLASRRASRFLYLGSLDEGAARNTSNGNQTSAPGQEAQDDAS